MRLSPVILAAGASSRMGSPKALLACGGHSFLSIISKSLGAARIPAAAVVVGADADVVAPAAENLGLFVIVNRNWESGRMSSVRLAARHAAQANGSLLLWPVDCPAVSVQVLTALLADAARHPGANIVPSFSRRGGHPVVLSASTCVELIASGPGNLRDALLSSGSVRRFLPVADPAVLDNLNTREQLASFLAARCPEGAHAG